MKTTLTFIVGFVLIALLYLTVFTFLFSLGYVTGWLFLVEMAGLKTILGVYTPYVTGFALAGISMAYSK